MPKDFMCHSGQILLLIIPRAPGLAPEQVGQGWVPGWSNRLLRRWLEPLGNVPRRETSRFPEWSDTELL